MANASAEKLKKRARQAACLWRSAEKTWATESAPNQPASRLSSSRWRACADRGQAGRWCCPWIHPRGCWPLCGRTATKLGWPTRCWPLRGKRAVLTVTSAPSTKRSSRSLGRVRPWGSQSLPSAVSMSLIERKPLDRSPRTAQLPWAASCPCCRAGLLDTEPARVGLAEQDQTECELRFEHCVCAHHPHVV